MAKRRDKLINSKIKAANVDAGTATDGYVLTSDGAGNTAWEAAGAGAEVNDLTAAVTWANIPIANVPTGTSGTTVSLGNHLHTGTYLTAVVAGDVNAEASTDGWVLTSDGAGNAAWEAVGAGAEVNDLTAAVTWTNIPIANVPTGTSGITVALGDHTHTGVYEPADATIVKSDEAETISSNWSFTGNVTLNDASNFYIFDSDNNAGMRMYHTGTAAVIRSHLSTPTLNFSAWDTIIIDGATTLTTGHITASGNVTGANLNISNWDAAYGWGDHASGGYGVLANNEVVSGHWSIPSTVNSKTTNYTLLLGDAGKTIRLTGASAGVVHTIPANASVAFPIGTMVAWQNDNTNQMTVGITTDTLTDAAGTTGTQTLLANAMAVATKVAATEWKWAMSPPEVTQEQNDLSLNVTWANIPIANVPTGTSGSTVALGDHLHAGVYEPVDATLVRNDDAAYNATEWDLAYGWGDHASGGYAVTGTVETFDSLSLTPDTTADSWGLRIESSNNPANDSGFWSTSNNWRLFLRDSAGNIDIDLNPGGTSVIANDMTIGGSTISGTLIGQWNTAYGWGDHASAGYQAALSFNVSGNWFGQHVPIVSSAGVMEVGKYMDWHETDAGVTDYDYRMNVASGVLNTTGGVAVTGAITGTTIGGITQANLVDKAANEVVTGHWSIPSTIYTDASSHTLVLGDAGKTVLFTGASAGLILTIPANSSVAFPTGTLICISNNNSNNVSIQITTDTLTWGADDTTGTRTLAPGGDAVIMKVTSTEWKINGSLLLT